MKKLILLSISLLMILMMGCSGGNSQTETTPIPDEEKAVYLEKAQEVIHYVIYGDFDSLAEISTEDLNNALTEDVKTQIAKDLETKGEFVEFGAGDGVTQKDKNSDKTYYITQQETVFKEGKSIFTVNFDEEGKVAGIFYK